MESLDKESIESNKNRQNELAHKIREFKNQIVDSRDIDKILKLNDLIIDWDKNLKAECRERFGSTQGLQAVKGWQVLVGGSEEEENDRLDSRQRDFLLNAVEKFYEELEEMNW